MLADLVKDATSAHLKQRDLRIKYLINTFNITENDATEIVDNYRDTDTQELIAKAMEQYELDLGDAEMFVDDYPNESEWAAVENAANELELDITDITPDDIEAINEAGGVKGILDSSIGIVKYIYNHKMLAYSILLLLDGKPLVYNNIEPNIMNEMINTDSVGSYYNDNLRGNTSYEGCGCKENSCEPTDLLLFSSIS